MNVPAAIYAPHPVGRSAGGWRKRGRVV